ncbi:MAG: thymidine phosphorylase, partial [Terriglobales bacterium]
CGLYVPMISGRGLGHTGGTLDKLESIPGFNVNLSLPEFRRVLSEAKCSLIGQTKEIAPADKKLYALRDVTGTVESPFLICASIMSKKLAEGVDALVLDVKTGSGAFMKKKQDAVFLAELMVETGRRMGKRTVALITDMNQPLGRAVGNALEVAECIEILNGGGAGDLRELSLQLAAWMLYLGERANSIAEGCQLAEAAIASGASREKFRDIIRLQCGDEGVMDEPGRLPQAKNKVGFTASQSGFVASIDCERVGTASVVLGGGREKKEDMVDPAVGLEIHKKLGDEVSAGEPLCTVHYNSAARLEEALGLLRAAYHIAPVAPEVPRTLIHQVIGS